MECLETLSRLQEWAEEESAYVGGKALSRAIQTIQDAQRDDYFACCVYSGITAIRVPIDDKREMRELVASLHADHVRDETLNDCMERMKHFVAHEDMNDAS